MPKIRTKLSGWLTGLDKNIHEPARLLVLTLLYQAGGRLDYKELKGLSGLSWGNLAAHLYKLEKGGYIKIQQSFQGRFPRRQVELSAQGRRRFKKYKHILKLWIKSI